MIMKNIDDAYIEFHLSEIEEKIGVTFNNRVNLLTALTSASYINENKVPWGSYERLAFLGDSVLQLLVTEKLYEENEVSFGELTTKRQFKVNDLVLAEKLRNLQIEKYLILGRGEKRNLESLGSKIFSNIYEALVGAIYHDMNCLKQARVFVQMTLIT